MATIVEWMNNLMTQRVGIGRETADMIDCSIAVIMLVVLCIIANVICQYIYGWITSHSRKIRESGWFRFVERRKLSRNILLLIPGIGFYWGVALLFDSNLHPVNILHRICIIYFNIVFILVINSALLSFLDMYSRSEKNRNHPLKSLIQGLQICTYFIGSIIIIALLINKSPASLLTGLGASAAVLMLIFKDSILGFVAGIQLSRNNMVRIGDWIQMPDGSANGLVEEITLNTVKIRNWDNTISMLPPYTLISTPFKNWRGMEESAGRQVDKCIYIDINSIKAGEDRSNIQEFRIYIETFLREHPDVNADLDLIVTQKEMTPYGVPVEIYFFIKEKGWESFEKKQSDIFAHIISAAPGFELKFYQRP